MCWKAECPWGWKADCQVVAPTECQWGWTWNLFSVKILMKIQCTREKAPQIILLLTWMTTSDTGSIHHQKRQSAVGVAKAFKVSPQLYSCVIGLP